MNWWQYVYFWDLFDLLSIIDRKITEQTDRGKIKRLKVLRYKVSIYRILNKYDLTESEYQNFGKVVER